MGRVHELCPKPTACFRCHNELSLRLINAWGFYFCMMAVSGPQIRRIRESRGSGATKLRVMVSLQPPDGDLPFLSAVQKVPLTSFMK